MSLVKNTNDNGFRSADDAHQPTFGQAPSSKETDSSGNNWIEVPGYPNARRFGSESEQGCSETETGY